MKALLSSFPDAELIHVRDSRAEEEDLSASDDPLEGVSFDDADDTSEFDF